MSVLKKIEVEQTVRLWETGLLSDTQFLGVRNLMDEDQIAQYASSLSNEAIIDTLKKLLEKEETPKYKDFPVIRLLENGDRIAALRLAIAAVELTTQKQPVHNPTPRYGMGDEYYDWVCPNCGTFLAYETQMTGPHHCKCGQAIKWEGLKNDEGDL